ncbi:MAG: hypothetical protein KGR69_03025 [Verrucomicrobia bacterium]|nr:hypothetical protein [Verrucomicrobiota bacterium]
MLLLRVWFHGMAHRVPCERGRPVSFGSDPFRELVAKDTILGRSMARA